MVPGLDSTALSQIIILLQETWVALSPWPLTLLWVGRRQIDALRDDQNAKAFRVHFKSSGYQNLFRPFFSESRVQISLQNKIVQAVNVGSMFLKSIIFMFSLCGWYLIFECICATEIYNDVLHFVKLCVTSFQHILTVNMKLPDSPVNLFLLLLLNHPLQVYKSFLISCHILLHSLSLADITPFIIFFFSQTSDFFLSPASPPAVRPSRHTLIQRVSWWDFYSSSRHKSLKVSHKCSPPCLIFLVFTWKWSLRYAGL